MNNFNFVEDNASLINYNTYKIKSSTRYLARPTNINELTNLVNYLTSNNIKYYILGKGSNVILSDSLYDGCIISLEHLDKIEIDDEVVTAYAGVTLGILIQEVMQHNLSGFEYLFGIPGTLGGALYGNAGAYNHTIYDNLVSVDILKDGNIYTLKKEDIKYSYRYTEFKENKDIIIKATFKLLKKDNKGTNEVIKEIREKRSKLPLEYPNAGSVFKNPLNDYAGRLIEEAGLKGYQIGGAKVSEKHANFIVNTGNMTSNDLKSLINYIKKEIKDKYNIELELEQVIIDGN